MQRVLQAMSFPFLIIAGFLMWEAYRLSKVQGVDWRVVLMLVGAMLSVSMGFLGVRYRHRRNGE